MLIRLKGIGNGANTATIPIWQSECSQSHNRGLLICIEAAMIAVGTVIAYWLDFGFSYMDNSAQWRFPIAFQILFAVLLIAGVMVLPESPRCAFPLSHIAVIHPDKPCRWLLNHGLEEDGLTVIAALNDTTLTDAETMKEKQVILDAIQLDSDAQKDSGFRDCFTRGKGKHLNRTLIGASSQMFQQLGGCNAVIVTTPAPRHPAFLLTATVLLPRAFRRVYRSRTHNGDDPRRC